MEKRYVNGGIIEYRDSTGQHTEKVIFDKGCFCVGMHCGSSTRVAPKLINTRIPIEVKIEREEYKQILKQIEQLNQRLIEIKK